jgi:3,4-dihydroxy 2-butanone 4-phosphate synthase
MKTAFTVSVDYIPGTSTGISAADRAATIQALVDPKARPDDFARPGHIFPLRAHPEGVIGRTGHTEAAVDLCLLAGKQPSGVICEICNDDGTMARLPDLELFAEQHGLLIATIKDLVDYRATAEQRNGSALNAA